MAPIRVALQLLISIMISVLVVILGGFLEAYSRGALDEGTWLPYSGIGASKRGFYSEEHTDFGRGIRSVGIWIDDEEERVKSCRETGLQYVILDMSAVGNIDTSGISMLDEVMKIVDRRGLKLALSNPGGEVMEKLNKSNFLERMGQEWIFLTVKDAVGACNYMLQSCKPKLDSGVSEKYCNNV
ncbi:hypothetical protein OROGR_019410 [Orobanche gracilis]